MMVKLNDWLPMPRFLLRKNALVSILNAISIDNKKCLEIGYGAGEILKLIAGRGAKVTAFDFSEEAANVAKHRISSFSKKENICFTSDIDEIGRGEYDCVIALEVLEHIEDDELSFSQWLDYLKPDGSLIISVPAHMAKWGDSDVWAGHYRRYEKLELIRMCEKNDVLIEQLWNYGYPLSIVLDRLLHSSKKNEVKDIESKGISNDELSKHSGIKRDNKLIYRMLSNDLMLAPFYLLQKLFYKYDFGAGYILHVKKGSDVRKV